MKKNLGAKTLGSLVLALTLGSVPLLAQASEDGFLSDYSGLKATPNDAFDQLFVAPGALTAASNYNAVMIDQPEIFLHPDSKYKGMKPDDMKAIADGLRAALSTELESGYKIVGAPGPGILYVRFAVSDLSMKKAKRSILSYTPVGFVVHSAVGLAKEVTDKIDLKNMKIEGEILDSQSQAQLAAVTASRGSLSGDKGAEETSWEELNGLFGVAAKRLRCRLDNGKLPESSWANCAAISLPVPAAK